MRRLLAPLLAAAALAAGCAGPPAREDPPRPPSGRAEGDARVVLERFTAAIAAARWSEAHALLSARWREVYTPEQLALDFDGAGAAGRELAERVASRLRAGAALEVEGSRAVLTLGPHRATLLLLEQDGWRVDALE